MSTALAAVSSVALWPVWTAWALTCAATVAVCWLRDRLPRRRSR